MASATFHISLPAELGREIDKEIKKGYYTPSEFFKMLYRHYREQQILKDLEEAEEDIRQGRVIRGKSSYDFMSEKE